MNKDDTVFDIGILYETIGMVGQYELPTPP